MRYILSVLLLLGALAPIHAKAMIGPQLEQALQSARSGEQVEILIVMKDQSDEEYLALLVKDLPRREQRYPVMENLKRLSEISQQPVLQVLEAGRRSAQVSDISPQWIVNAVYCKATAEAIAAVAELESVEYIEFPHIVSDNILLLDGEPVEIKGDPSRTVEWNVRKVGADTCWNAGYKGAGVIVGHIDTGCNYNHMDLRNHMWTDPAYPLHGWNFELNNNNPIDGGSHGTHTAGTVASDGSAGDSCGMAPQCSIMVCRVRTSIAYPHPDTISEKNLLDAIQFVISPPAAPTHGADLVTMSLGWYVAWTPRRSLWRKCVTNVALAGMPFFIAAGNERSSAGGTCPIPYNLRCPGDAPPPWHHPAEVKGRLGGAISVAATDNADALASFSSVGPSSWETAQWYWDYPWRPGAGILKPDIAAPGVNIISCSSGSTTGYATMSGTSMATPCMAGCCALLLSKNPNLTLAQVDSILQFTSLDLGTAGKDTMFGAGRVRVYQAINQVPASGSGPYFMLAEHNGHVVQDPAPTGNANAFFDPSETITLIDTIVNTGSGTATNVTGVLRTGNTHITIVDSLASFGTIAAKARGHNAADPFVLRADTLINLGDTVRYTLALTAGAYTQSLSFLVKMGSVGGPDSFGYYMLDNTDTLYTEAPVYNWVEINPAHGGPGTSLGTGGGNVSVRALMPFTFRHYGKRIGSSDSLTICTNGWICQRRSTVAVAHNSMLPKIVDYGSQPTLPNQIAVYWDTLNSTSPAAWLRYYDSANRRFIVEWDSVRGALAYAQVFEVMIYDTTTAGRFGCNDIVCQYKVVREPTSCTIGQQDSLKKVGLTYLFNNLFYETGSPAVQAGRAIKFTTKIPRMRQWIVPVAEFNDYPDMGGRRLAVSPNPSRGRATLFYNVTQRGRVMLRVYNAAGQLVSTVLDEVKQPGVYTGTWNGRDDHGRTAAAGIYFYRLDTGGETATARSVLLR